MLSQKVIGSIPASVTFPNQPKVRFIIWSPPQGKFAFLGRLTKQKTELTAVDQEVNISKLGWDDGQV